MKKIIIIIATLFIGISTANALEIDSLGFKSNDLKDIEITTRDNTDKTYFMYAHDIYAQGENDKYIFYIRAIENPGIKDFNIKDDLSDEVYGLIGKKDTNEYAYVYNNNYKWIKIQFHDQNYSLIEYYISWKNIFITITFQAKQGDIEKSDIFAFDSFVKSIQLNGQGKADISHVLLSGIDYKKEPEKKNYTTLIIVCLCAIGLAYCIKTKKIKLFKREDEE